MYTLKLSVLLVILLYLLNLNAQDSTFVLDYHQPAYFGNPYMLDDSQIENLPVRGMDYYLRLMPGIVFQDGVMHVRAAFGNSTKFILNDADITTPFDYSREVYIIPEAIENFYLTTAGTPSVHGGTGSGYVFTRLKRGDDQFRFVINSQTDKFASGGDQFLNTYSYRDHYFTALASGPIIKEKAYFFVALENEEIGDTQKRFSKGYAFNNLIDMNPANPEVFNGNAEVVGKMSYPDGFTPKNSSNRWAMNTFITSDFKPFNFEITGAYDRQKLYADDRPMLNILNDRAQYLERYTFFANGKLKHRLSPDDSYDISAGYIQSFDELKDDYFGNDWQSWQDSAKIADHTNGMIVYRDAWRPDYDYLFNGFSFTRNGDLLNDYYKYKHTGWTFSGSYKNTMIKNNVLHAGFSYKTHTLRQYSIDPFIMAYTDENYESIGMHYASLEDINDAVFAAYLDEVYGYDRFGNEGDELFEAIKPKITNTFIQNQYRYKRLTAIAGIRYIHYNSGKKYLSDPANPVVDPETGMILSSEWKNREPDSHFNPWFGLSLDLNQYHNVFFKYNSVKIYEDNYNPYSEYRQIIAGGFYYLPNLNTGYNERNINTYEAGYSGNLSDALSLTSSVYTRKFKSDWTGLAGTNRIIEDDGSMALGMELAVRTNRKYNLIGTCAYTFTTTEDEEARFSYQHTHVGIINLDYRIGENKGGNVFNNFGANLLFRFQSGHPYTKVQVIGGQTNPYEGGVDYMLDTRSRLAVESINKSTTPWNYYIDLMIDKSISLFDNLNLKIYCRILNLLNTRNVINVYELTGEADDDGFYDSPAREILITQYGQEYENLYKAINLENGQAYWDLVGKQLYGHPRQILFGMQISY